ncbi:hypothetical protein CTZ27_36465 [Streptomyces griseocarneus]|nr:hypothetical protein CTZ27_36465 [Streptomyces griseocarneus]
MRLLHSRGKALLKKYTDEVRRLETELESARQRLKTLLAEAAGEEGYAVAGWISAGPGARHPVLLELLLSATAGLWVHTDDS